jgi:hypothetical protein
MSELSQDVFRSYALIDLGIARRWAEWAEGAGLDPGIDALLSRAEEHLGAQIVRGLAFSGRHEPGPSTSEDDAFLGRLIDYRPIAPEEPTFIERASHFLNSTLQSSHSNLLILGKTPGLVEVARRFRAKLPAAEVRVLVWSPDPDVENEYAVIPGAEIVSLEPRQPSFVLIDLDSVISWSVPDRELSEILGSVLDRIESETGWDLRGGQATMNQHTRDNLSPRVFRMLQHRKIETKVVKTEPEASDKHLIGTMLYQLGNGIRRFAILSSDKGFAQAIDWAQDNSQEVEFVVVVEREGSPTVNAYSNLKRVRLLSVRESARHRGAGTGAGAGTADGLQQEPWAPTRPPGWKTPPQRPGVVPGTGARPMPTPQPAGWKTPLQRSNAAPAGARPAVAPRPGQVLAGASGPRGAIYSPATVHALVCGCCGVRQIRVGINALCFRCGSRLSIPAVPASDRPAIFPPNREPFRDGPILEVWRDRQLRRIVVLSNQTMVFGQRFDDAMSVSKVGLGDLLDEPNMISRKQFQISEKREGEFVLTHLGSRPMYHDAEGSFPLRPEEELALAEGQNLFLNAPSDRGSRLQFVFRSVQSFS